MRFGDVLLRCILQTWSPRSAQRCQVPSDGDTHLRRSSTLFAVYSDVFVNTWGERLGRWSHFDKGACNAFHSKFITSKCNSNTPRGIWSFNKRVLVKVSPGQPQKDSEAAKTWHLKAPFYHPSWFTSYTRLSSATKAEFHKSPRTLRIKSHFHYQVPEEVGSLFLLNTRFAKSLSGFNNHTYNAAKDGFQQKKRDPSTDTLNLHRLNCYPAVLRLICLLTVLNFLSIHVFFQAFTCALPILKASPWSGAKSSLYGFHSVMFSHGLIALTNSCWLWYDPLNSHLLFLFVTLW